ncbi:hypothetical protein SCATT_46260 [Streptantibioticus cattleyicolor NRRL 8057 = DSM 46488]|uniref:Uncharacterized protein n=1 Tax=Streptantibioticus cattleyicolor (strain ATCC 35852 / DSM 46488 / JCM 4925 / NBRC 14057 / NRRL 8057) TaxID=1003195 RepID=G8X3E6_STREN|nr:hypothetical protein SCATT_46260 [Streptantibioticus cattleyicolor NRRL 8057 = DSM 46488]
MIGSLAEKAEKSMFPQVLITGSTRDGASEVRHSDRVRS